MHLLMADDNAVNQKVALRLFDQMGYHIDIAADGHEAIEAVRAHAYDIIFMDVQMPEMNGLEATRRIREIERESGKPRSVIIAMTASAMSGDRERCLDAGMDDYLAKPVRPEAVQSALERWGPQVSRPGPRTAGTRDTSVRAAEPAPPPVPPAPPEPSVAPEAPVDLERLTEMSGTDEPSVRELTDLYLLQTGEQLQELRQAIAAGDAREVERVAHKAAGASSTCGIVAVVPAFRELERLGREGRLENACALFEEVNHKLENVRAFLAEHLAALRSRSNGNPP